MHVCVHGWRRCGRIGNYVDVCVYNIYIYIYIYICGRPPHELPTLVLHLKYRVKPAFPARILYLERLPKPNPHLNRTHPSNRSGSMWARTQRQQPTARKFVQDRHEHALNGNTVFFQSKPNLSQGKRRKQHLLETIRPDTKTIFWFSLGKVGYRFV